MNKVLTFGVFDLLHKGHVELFRRAKELGDYLIVAVQEDEYIKLFKPNANVANTLSDRMYMVKAIRYVDDVVPYTAADLSIDKISFDTLVHGPDQNHDGFIKCFEWCKDNGKQVVELSRTDGVSSTEIKDKIKKRL